MNEEWIPITIRPYVADFEKETEKAYCFRLWGAKFIAFPKKFMRFEPFITENGQYEFTMPKWYIEKHSLKSLVTAEQKSLFPGKRELAKREKERLQPNLLISSVEDTPSVPTTSSIKESSLGYGISVDKDEDFSF